MKRFAAKGRALDGALRDILLPLCAAVAVVAIAAFAVAPPSVPTPRLQRFQQDPRDFAAFSFLVWRAVPTLDSIPVLE